VLRKMSFSHSNRNVQTAPSLLPATVPHGRYHKSLLPDLVTLRPPGRVNFDSGELQTYLTDPFGGTSALRQRHRIKLLPYYSHRTMAQVWQLLRYQAVSERHHYGACGHQRLRPYHFRMLCHPTVRAFFFHPTIKSPSPRSAPFTFPLYHKLRLLH
jgi:hypothetical protein